MTVVRAGNAGVELSRTDKVFFPGDQITKGDLIDYYAAVAERMLPHLRGRPLALARYPDGITGQGIFQKNIHDHFPGWVDRAEVGKEGGGTVCHAVAEKAATLVYLANQGAVELHTFLSRAGSLRRPDQLVIDLDPPDGGFDGARQAALLARRLLEDDLGLTTFVKTTGGKGLHVHIPLDSRAGFDEARAFAKSVAGLLAGRHPDLITTEQRRDKRGGRVYADVMRDAYAQTAVAPYSVRARAGATVATPLRWSEARDPSLAPEAFTLRSVPGRLERHSGADDPWAGMTRRRYGLGRASERLARLAAAGQAR